MTKDVKTVEIMASIGKNLIFDHDPMCFADSRLRNCTWNDILLKHIEKLGEFRDADEYGCFLMWVAARQKCGRL